MAKLSKFLAYVLGRRPDEFGLLPDDQGYVKVKELINALSEASGWRHVRINHLYEVVNAVATPTVQLEGSRIRAADRSRIITAHIVETPPKLVYYPIRRRAHPVVHQKGVSLHGPDDRMVMADSLDMATRLGRRIDPSPVILTVNTILAHADGITWWRFGEQLFLADGLPVGCFSGPPLPKDRPESPKAKKKPAAPVAPTTPGSYLIDVSDATPGSQPRPSRSQHRKNEWKRDRKRKNRSDPYR
jgi:putative RNA 2'-phosphotransferase